MKFNQIQKIIISIVGITICICFLYILSIFSNKEGFITSPSPVSYSETTITELKNYQVKLQSEGKQGLIFKVEDLQKLGVPEESVKTYITSGSWPWSQGFTNAVKQMMINEPNKNNTTITEDIIKTQKVWPEQFLLLWLTGLGFNIGFTNVAKSKKLSCKIDSTTKKSTGDSMYTIDDSGNVTNSAVDNNLLPTLIPGFKFLSKPCNPCETLNGNFSCPFAYPDTNGQTLFPGFVMEYAWGLTPTEAKSSVLNNPNPNLPTLSLPNNLIPISSSATSSSSTSTSPTNSLPNLF
jgi:hypothetical protein